MDSPPENDFDPILLDLHLGQLDPEQRAAVERRIAGDPALQAENQALTAIFAALNSLRQDVPQPPADLVGRVAMRVAAAGRPGRIVFPPLSVVQLADDYGNAGIIRLRSLREIVAVAALIVLAVGLGVPGMLHLRERGQRIACSANLAGIGQGMQAYALANQSWLPFAGWNSNSTWRPTDQAGLDVLPNRTHVYRLVMQRLVPARLFVCPSGNDLPMPEDQVPYHTDFLEARNVSYAYQNMAGVRPSLRDDPDLPILGDDNPLFDNGWPLLSATRSLGLGDPTFLNSRAHAGSGQNILTLLGSVKWMTTPNCGLGGDNIWTLQGVDEYTGREGPQAASDAHLLK